MLNEELLEQLQEEKELHDYDYHSGHPALYVGTYGKYNGGSLDGMWVDLTTFSDYDDFMDFCHLLHRKPQWQHHPTKTRTTALRLRCVFFLAQAVFFCIFA